MTGTLNRNQLIKWLILILISVLFLLLIAYSLYFLSVKGKSCPVPLICPHFRTGRGSVNKSSAFGIFIWCLGHWSIFMWTCWTYELQNMIMSQNKSTQFHGFLSSSWQGQTVNNKVTLNHVIEATILIQKRHSKNRDHFTSEWYF